MANERRLLMRRELAPRDRDESRPMRNIEEPIVLGVAVSTLEKVNHI